MKKTFPLQDVLAMSFAAFRIRGDYVKETRRYSEDKTTEHSNKDMLKQHFGQYRDPDFVDFTATEEDYEGVKLAQNHFKKYTLQLLGDSMSDFQKDVFATLNLKDVPFAKLGLVAFVPKLVQRELEESKFKKLLRMEYRNSQHIGSLKEPVTGAIKIISKFYSENWESYNYIADFNGDLVSFMNKFEYNVGDWKRIKAKVKDHTKNRNFDVNETRLNYTKLTKV